jgi:hypothetical protein
MFDDSAKAPAGRRERHRTVRMTLLHIFVQLMIPLSPDAGTYYVKLA